MKKPLTDQLSVDVAPPSGGVSSFQALCVEVQLIDTFAQRWFTRRRGGRSLPGFRFVRPQDRLATTTTLERWEP